MLFTRYIIDHTNCNVELLLIWLIKTHSTSIVVSIENLYKNELDTTKHNTNVDDNGLVLVA